MQTNRFTRLLTRTASATVAASLVALVSASSVVAQTGTIRGTVTRADTHTPIMGARVSILNPERVAISDERGAFVLRDVPAGTFSVFTTAIGKKPDSSSVTVAANRDASLNIGLKDGSLLLSSVVVSATRTPVEANKVASTVNVLSPEAVRQSPARESQDLLREITAVELPRTSSLVGGTAQIVSIRGVDEGRTAVLADGIPVNDAWGEWIDWGRIPKAMLDRVEVVEGGTSNLYGNGAMGGAISFFTRPLAPGAMSMQVDGGSRGSKHAFIGGGIPLVGALSANVSGDYQEKGGYVLTRDPIPGSLDTTTSQVYQRNLYTRLNYAPSSSWSAFVGSHFFGDSRNPGTPLSYANRDQRDLSLGVNYGAYSTGMLGVRAWNGRQIEKQRSTAFRSGLTRAQEDSSLTAAIPSHDWGASAIWTRTGLPFKLESFSLGGDFRHYQGDFNEIDFTTSGCPASATCHTVARNVSSGGAQSLSGVFAQAIFAPYTPLRVELSARGDRWDNTDGHSLTTIPGSTASAVSYGDSSKSAFSPRVGVRYSVSSNLSFHAAYYRAFRAPNLAELYRKQVSPQSITVPNPFLKAENAEGREAGFDFQPLEWLQVKGTWYVADYNNFNVPTALTATSNPPKPAECGTVATCRTRLNVNKSRSEGGEAYIALHPIPELFLSGSVNYDDDRQQSGLPATATDNTKPHINRVPSPKQTIRATYSSALLGDWTAIWRHEGHTTTLQGVWLNPYTVMDVNVQRELMSGIRGFVSVENIANANYQISLALPTPTSPLLEQRGLPRTVRAGVEAYRF